VVKEVCREEHLKAIVNKKVVAADSWGEMNGTLNRVKTPHYQIITEGYQFEWVIVRPWWSRLSSDNSGDSSMSNMG
jgi:hypothetical protein